MRRDTLMRMPGDSAMPMSPAMMRMMQLMQGPLGIPMQREGSGTSWLPDSTRMYAAHRMAGSWLLMLHGNLFAQYISEGGDRGDDQFGSINWIMGMARRKAAGGDLTFRAMMSAEPVTVGECGYPDLLATGESCSGGEPIHDRQHPHDLFMELAAGYERELTPGLAFQLYGGPVGEPAIGPVAYPHRLSAFPNPIAPIGHHWFDATHITFGVATAGLFGRSWKVEGSVFNGREPDEDRYDLDLDRLDSYSGRLWLLPSANWAIQASAGRLTEVEPGRGGEPPGDQTRITASATYHRPLAMQGTWASTAAWGRNVEEDHSTNAFLVETNLNLAERNVFFVRAEAAEKTGEDLVLEDPALSERIFTVSTVGGGYVRQFGPFGSLVASLGARAAVSFVPSDLESFYGFRFPTGFAVFVNLRPRPMSMDEMGGMQHREQMRHGGPMEGMQHGAMQERERPRAPLRPGAREDAARAAPGDWTLPARDHAGTRYSPVDQIPTANARSLQVAWTFSTGITTGHERNPLEVDGTMYVVTPFPNKLYALDLTREGRR